MAGREVWQREQPDWERMWAPYDEPTYEAVLAQLCPKDIVVEIGAGDLRLARRMARIVKKVIAIEIQPPVLETGLLSGGPLPPNLIPIAGDALRLPFPAEVTVGVLLMRHCTQPHFQQYVTRLKGSGCAKLITNARWRLGVETVFLQANRQKFEQVQIGWYACLCGGTGFVSGPAEKITPQAEAVIHEVSDCPLCRSSLRSINQ